MKEEKSTNEVVEEVEETEVEVEELTAEETAEVVEEVQKEPEVPKWKKFLQKAKCGTDTIAKWIGYGVIAAGGVVAGVLFSNRNKDSLPDGVDPKAIPVDIPEENRLLETSCNDSEEVKVED